MTVGAPHTIVRISPAADSTRIRSAWRRSDAQENRVTSPTTTPENDRRHGSALSTSRPAIVNREAALLVDTRIRRSCASHCAEMHRYGTAQETQRPRRNPRRSSTPFADIASRSRPNQTQSRSSGRVQSRHFGHIRCTGPERKSQDSGFSWTAGEPHVDLGRRSVNGIRGPESVFEFIGFEEAPREGLYG